MLKRFLGLTEEEIVENDQMWREEKEEPDLDVDPGQQMRGVNVTPGGIESDIATGEELANAEAGATTPQDIAMPAVPTAGATPGASAPPVPSI